MSFRGRPKTACLSNEELEKQKTERLEAREKAKKERAEKRKMKNKGYGSERKPYTHKESFILAKPSSSRRETSNFGARFPVEESSTSVVLNNEKSNHSMEYEKMLTAKVIPNQLLDSFSCRTDIPPHEPEPEIIIKEIQLDQTDLALRLHNEHSYSIPSFARPKNQKINDVNNSSTHKEYPFNTNTECEQQTVGKSKEIYCVHNIDYVEPKSSEINVAAMSSQFYDPVDLTNYPVDISSDTDEDGAVLCAPLMSVEKLDFGLQCDGFRKIKDGRIDKCLDVILESSAADNTGTILLPNDTLRIPEGWEERSRKQTEFGPTYVTVFYEIMLMENTVPIVFKSVTIDFLENKVSAYLLSHLVCYGGPQSFTNFREINAFIEKFNAAITCDGVRDDKFCNMSRVPNGSFSDQVWRSNDCQLLVEDDGKLLCEECALLRKALTDRLLRPLEEIDEDKAKVIKYKYLSRQQVEERLRQVTQQQKTQKNNVSRRKVLI